VAGYEVPVHADIPHHNPRPPRAGPIEANPSFAASDWRRLDDVHALPLRSESGREAKPTPAPYDPIVVVALAPSCPTVWGRSQWTGTMAGALSLKSEATRRGARMLRTALRPAIATWLEDPAVVEVNASRTRFDTLRRASADLKSWQNKEKC
jgi:hypothetical protein